MSEWVLLCSRRPRLDDMPFLPSGLNQAVAPDTPPIMVSRSSFLLVRGVHSNPLRSRVRTFESCRGHQLKLSKSNTQPNEGGSRALGR
jgi:hypothetical protein